MNAMPFFLWLALPTLTLGQPTTPPTTAPAMAVSGAFFALYVADVQASAKWYSEKLGLTVVMDEPKQGKAAAIVLEGGGLIVELIQHDDAVALSRAAPGIPNHVLVHGMVKAGAIVADFDKTLSTLRERNVRIAFGPYPPSATQRANVSFEDNAGNLIQFFGR
jgi:catechol 2,3-dioxygenase-like lactoylglutathione lyase family enzyme